MRSESGRGGRIGKRGGMLGGTSTTFFATIVIVVILLVFAFSASITRLVDESAGGLKVYDGEKKGLGDVSDYAPLLKVRFEIARKRIDGVLVDVEGVLSGVGR